MVPFWSAAAGSTGRFSGGLLRRRSHFLHRHGGPFLPPPLTGVAAGEPVLVPETVEDPLRRVPLLVVAGPIVFQNPIDDPRERTQLRPPWRLAAAIPRRPPRTTASCVPSCGPARTPAGPRGCSFPRHDTPAEPARTNPPDTSPRLPVRATLTEGYRRSHFGLPQPDQPAASVGDYCAAVLRDKPLNPNG